ncbi:MAG: thymidine phosphorylase [bacterium]|nr:thymidine phosphorylase [bacterium]
MKTIVDIIEHKQAGLELSDEEIKKIVQEYDQGLIPDYQMSALLMAIYFQGMTPKETATLLQAMVNSGERLQWSNLNGPVVDKHSTGGVGDKISLMLAPLLAAEGCYVPMISGRGLGHTGGTLDKLDSIPGFRTQLTLEEIKKLLPKVGCVMAGQTEEIAPVDKKMYALRDVTATIRAIPLITTSILSKKLSEGLDGLVIDLKVGKGAFAKDFEFAKKLAVSLYQNATASNIATRVLLTKMDIPIGQTIGNWLEVKEAMEWLQGKETNPELSELTLSLGTEVLDAVGRGPKNKAMERLISLWKGGYAFEKWLQIVEAQKGDVSYLLNLNKMPQARVVYCVKAKKEGYLNGVDALIFGKLAVLLGAGRKVMSDTIDPLAGFRFLKKWGDWVENGEPIVEIHTNRETMGELISEQCYQVIELNEIQEKPTNWVIEQYPNE